MQSVFPLLRHLRLVVSTTGLWLVTTVALLATLPAAADTSAKEAELPAIHIDLKNPVAKRGELTTEQGGVLHIKSLNFWLQARHIHITQTQPQQLFSAKGQLLIQYRNLILTGDHIHYNIVTRSGELTQARAGMGPWIIQGKKLLFQPDGSIEIDQAQVTSDPDPKPQWVIFTEKVLISPTGKIHFKHVSGKLMQLPALWLPSSSINLKTGWHAPFYIRPYLRKGKAGLRVIYPIYRSESSIHKLILDYRQKLGAGIGLHSQWIPSADQHFQGNFFSYVAQNRRYTPLPAIETSSRHCRYRFLGNFSGRFGTESSLPWHYEGFYDKLSDVHFTSDFQSARAYRLPVNPSFLTLWRQQPNLTYSLTTQVKLNNFKTVKEELPRLDFALKPIRLTNLPTEQPIWFHLQGHLSRLNLNHSRHAMQKGGLKDQHALRLYLDSALTTTFAMGRWLFTPKGQLILRGYDNNRNQQGDTLLIPHGQIGFLLQQRNFFSFPHSLVKCTPYIDYRHYLTPHTLQQKAPLFDTMDATGNYQQLRAGVRLNWHDRQQGIERTEPWHQVDLYLQTIHTRADHQAPRNLKLQWNWWLTNKARLSNELSWDLRKKRFEEHKVRLDYTLSQTIATGIEWRHRQDTVWRRSLSDCYHLEALTKKSTLTAPVGNKLPLSDPGHILIWRAYSRFLPDWSFHLQCFYGWGRKMGNPRYKGIECHLQTQLRSRATLRLNFAKVHREKWSISFELLQPFF